MIMDDRTRGPCAPALRLRHPAPAVLADRLDILSHGTDVA
jgi:hypothetical protein